MTDLLLLATMAFVCWALGDPIAALLPERLAWRLLLGPVLGFAVLAITVPVAYRLGASIRSYFGASLVIAAVLVALRARRVVRAVTILDPGERRRALLACCTALGVTLVVLAPRWVGGDQFAVFQGNHWDAFGYVESAASYATTSYATVSQATDHDIIRDPLLELGQQSLTNRPSAHLLYAVFSRVAPSDFVRLYYAYLAFFWGQLALVGLFALRNLLPRARPLAWVAIASAFPLGFWGQYVFDINAWSQIAATPLLFAMFALLVLATTSPAGEDDRPRDALRMPGVAALAIAGTVFVYPEGFLFYAFALAPPVVIVPIVRMWRARRFDPWLLAPIASFASVALAALYPPLLHHLVAQVTQTSATKVPWWDFFDAFYAGRDGAWGDGASRAIDFAAGLSGLYFATPASDGLLAVVERVAIVAVLVGAVVGIIALVVRNELLREERTRITLWIAISLLLLAPAAYLFSDANYWPAGKAISYAAPVFVPLLGVPASIAFRARTLSAVRWLAAAFLAFQLVCGIARIAAAADSDGIHYARPYPTVQLERLKRDLGWNLSGLDEYLSPSTRVLLEPMDVWPQAELMVYLRTRHVPFAIAQEVVSYFGAGRKLGWLPAPWRPDVRIIVERDAFVLWFADRSEPIRVDSR